jgi:transposase-like protein
MDGIEGDGGGQQVLEAGRRIRRQWTAVEKRRIVREAQKRGAVKQEVAARHGVHVSVLNRWRAEDRVASSGARKAVKPARLLPVRVHSPRPTRRSSQPVEATIAVTAKLNTIEVALSSGGRVYVRGVVDPLMLRAVLQELSQS